MNTFFNEYGFEMLFKPQVCKMNFVSSSVLKWRKLVEKKLPIRIYEDYKHSA